MSAEVEENRVVTNSDIRQYIPLVEKFLRDSVIKNWNEAKLHNAGYDQTMGNTGMSVDDIRQHLLTEVCVALQKFDPSRKVKEITFVYTHLRNRCGQLMKKLTKKSSGYGVWTQNLEDVFENTPHNDEE